MSAACYSSKTGNIPELSLFSFSNSLPSGNFGTGKDGPLTVSAPSTIINTYSEITDTALSAGSTTMNVAAAGGFSVGDLILVIQMQNGIGNFPKEYTTITAIAGNSLTVNPPLVNGYVSNNFGQPNTLPASVLASQIVRIGEYTDVTVDSSASIVAQAWNGNTGGIIAFRAKGKVTINGLIDTTGQGFRAGTSMLGAPITSFQGESHRGVGIQSRSQNNGAGGGSSTAPVCSTASGGMAAYVTPASGTGIGLFCCSALPASPGIAIPVTALSDFILGPGGGGSAWDLCSGFSFPPAGAGGGMIFIEAYELEISGTGSIRANGQDGLDNTSPVQLGASGAGGSIYIRANSLNTGLNQITALGGSTPNIPSIAGSGPIRVDFVSGSFSTNPGIGFGSTTTTAKSPLEQ